MQTPLSVAIVDFIAFVDKHDKEFFSTTPHLAIRIWQHPLRTKDERFAEILNRGTRLLGILKKADSRDPVAGKLAEFLNTIRESWSHSPGHWDMLKAGLQVRALRAVSPEDDHLIRERYECLITEAVAAFISFADQYDKEFFSNTVFSSSNRIRLSALVTERLAEVLNRGDRIVCMLRLLRSGDPLAEDLYNFLGTIRQSWSNSLGHWETLKYSLQHRTEHGTTLETGVQDQSQRELNQSVRFLEDGCKQTDTVVQVVGLSATSGTLSEPEAKTPTTSSPPDWAELGEAKQNILIALKEVGKRINGRMLAEKAGYSYGSLRHHVPLLQQWCYIDKTKDGYAITSTGASLAPSKLE